MDTKQRGDREDSELLTSQERANGFSVQLSDSRDITLLKRDKRVAWFSAAVLPETVGAMVKLIASCREAAKH